jgi:two-component system, sensor histidine kinase RegB
MSLASPISGGSDEPQGQFEAQAANRKNMELLIQLRWIAVIGQIATIAVASRWLGFDLPLPPMAAILAAQIAHNLISIVMLRRGVSVGRVALTLALTLDVLALTAQLWLTGGAANPFISLYLLQITLAAVLLDAAATWALAVLCGLVYFGLTLSNRPLVLEDQDQAEMFRLHVLGALACFILVAVLLVIFVIRISRNLRRRDENLSALRQRAVEEDHVVRIGLLASGAAHELGSPLSSVAVILNDWSRLYAVQQDTEMAQELAEMQAAIERCKSILTGILLSAGEARGEAVETTSLQAMLAGIDAAWCATHPDAVLTVHNRVGEDLPVIADTALRQVLFCVLDNAYEASPDVISLTASREKDVLVLAVTDRGPGFPPDMLTRIGRPYQSSKATPGSGLGLFLVANVARRFGGEMRAENMEGGGARVTLRLPLDKLTPGAVRHAD